MEASYGECGSTAEKINNIHGDDGDDDDRDHEKERERE